MYGTFIDSKPTFRFYVLPFGRAYTNCTCKGFPDMEVIGETLDDAAGEAFDNQLNY